MIIPVKDIPKPGPEYTTGYTQGRADQIAKHQEEREQLQAELDEEIEAVAQHIKLLGERTQQNKQLQDDVRKLSRSLLIFENAISVRGAIAEADKAKLVEALFDHRADLHCYSSRPCPTCRNSAEVLGIADKVPYCCARQETDDKARAVLKEIS